MLHSSRGICMVKQMPYLSLSTAFVFTLHVSFSLSTILVPLLKTNTALKLRLLYIQARSTKSTYLTSELSILPCWGWWQGWWFSASPLVVHPSCPPGWGIYRDWHTCQTVGRILSCLLHWGACLPSAPSRACSPGSLDPHTPCHIETLLQDWHTEGHQPVRTIENHW